MDTARAIMEKHMAYLEYIQSSSQTVDGIMKERKELIQVNVYYYTQWQNGYEHVSHHPFFIIFII